MPSLNHHFSSSYKFQPGRFAPHCNFCKRNQEPEHVYSSHRLKDEVGNVTCPQLYKHRCELCGATGISAHTRSYCPNAMSIRNSGPRSVRNNQASINDHQETRSSVSSHASTNDFSGDAQLRVGGEPSIQTPDVELTIRPDRRFRNMSQLTNSRYNSAGRIRRQFRQRFQNTHQP